MTTLFKKGMVLLVICLFIGAGIVPSISGNIVEKQNTEVIDDYVDAVSLPPDDELDQYQNISSNWLNFSVYSLYGQSFKPTKNILTRVKHSRIPLCFNRG
jgi:hypothetical protein